jgi:toxin ParE1/3/4
MAEYRLAPAAERDLEMIWSETARRWGVAQANRYLDFLAGAFAELACMPGIAAACDHIRQGYRRRHVERHMIYLRATDYGVAVIRILHDRMDAPRHL